jgi:8-oxo-dGTP pyrophosphatase MutT (NUDIX family)
MNAQMIRAAFVLFRAPGGKVLLVRRTKAGDHADEWSLPGGKIKAGETSKAAALRECVEELGYYAGDVGRWHMRRVRDGVDATTFCKDVEEEFVPPRLNEEHDAYVWIDPGEALAMGAE